MKKYSLKTRLISLGVIIGMLMAVMSVVLPIKSKKIIENVMVNGAKSAVSLLALSLQIPVQSFELDEGLSLESALQVIEKDPAVSRVDVYDAELNWMGGLNSSWNSELNQKVNEMEARKFNDYFTMVTPLQDAAGENIAYVKVNYLKSEADIGQMNTCFKMVIMFSVGMIALIVIVFFWFSNSITQTIDRVARGLSESFQQVFLSSTQMSSSSQRLAEAASEQAASVEETLSALEEMASTTRRNAGNANQADSLMKEANEVVAAANASMNEMLSSMEEISKASDETSKIIKTIDEISFQTNLLALNAAVEAARAGDAGAGFAVVADEVRSLAMRAAEASKNTAMLIEGTVRKVNDGRELVAKTNEAFLQVAENSVKVGGLVGEISAASGEQAEGIEQINRVVAEIDNVVQQNAANAEESAAASEEMLGRSQMMDVYVGELAAIVSGSSERRSGKKTKALIGSGRHVPLIAQKKLVAA